LTRKNVNPNDNVSWKEGVLVFNGAPFNDFIVRLERWYNIRVIYQPEDFKDIHFTGTIRDLRLDQVFEFVSLTTPIEVDMGDNDIHLKRTQPKSSN
jgi:ferric-dicitrate binding protein FerR (iron transport regulator)